MKNKLQQYFPMIRTKEEIMANIENDEHLQVMFYWWTKEQRKEFLDLLSLLLEQKVRIVEVLPSDSTRIADETSLVLMDIVVQLEDGSIANLEIQEIGYKFPGERSACYSADLLLRQYKRVRSRKKKKFSYKDIKPVYTIVLFEQSPSVFSKFPNEYLHYFEQKSNTGLKINLLQKYVFIPLDIFCRIQQNKDGIVKIESRLDAWFAFMCMDEPEIIISIIKKYPDFKAMYEHVYNICQNIEEVMNMFSEELRELDRNTVQLMIDEMQEEISQKTQELEQKDQQIEQMKETIRRLSESEKIQ